MPLDTRRKIRIAVGLAIVVIGLLVAQFSRQGADAPPVAEPPRQAEQAKNPPTTIADVTIRGESGRVVFEGEVDLAETLARIEAGRKLRFKNDGSVFQNRERRLPRQREGYYREWVHPTPGLSGPGPQRVVTGEKDEAYYTPDHYRTFERVR
jgi:ribonuclease T1